MTMIPSNVGTLTEVPTFDTEERLYQWMDATVGDSYERAKEVVAEWWARVVVALVGADKHYGYNTMAGLRNGKPYKVPPQLEEWCQNNGLTTSALRNRARAMGRVYLTNGEIESVLSTVSPSIVEQVGRGNPEFIPVKLEAALNGATFREITELQKSLHNDPEYLQRQLHEAERYLQEVERAFEAVKSDPHHTTKDYHKAYELVKSANASLSRIQDKSWSSVASTPTQVGACSLGLTTTEYRPLPDQLQQAQVEADAAREALESYTGQKSERIKQYAELKQTDREARIKLCRLQELVDGLPKQEEAKPQEQTVTPEYQALMDQVAQLNQQNLELLEVAKKKEQEDQEYLIMQEEIKRLEKSKKHIEFKFEQLSNPYSNDQSTLELRLHIVRNTGNHWEELALTFPEARSITQDPFTLGQAERAIMSSWDAWIKHLPMDMIHELQQKIEQRVAAGDATTPPTNYTTVDIVAV